MNNETVASPCISVCAIDTDEVCVGCLRSLDEIMDWPDASEDERRRVIRNTVQRRKSAGHAPDDL